MTAAELTDMRSALEALEREVAGIDAELARCSTRREALLEQREQPGVSAHAVWSIDDELLDLEGEIVALIDRKRRPAARAAQLRALLAPAAEREREAEDRYAAIAGHEALLEVYALLERCVPLLAEARRLDGIARGRVGFGRSMEQLSQLISRWRDVQAPQLRQHLADDRTWLAGVAR